MMIEFGSFSRNVQTIVSFWNALELIVIELLEKQNSQQNERWFEVKNVRTRLEKNIALKQVR